MSVRFGVYPEFWKTSRLAATSALSYTSSTMKCGLLTSSYSPTNAHVNWSDVSSNQVATGSTYLDGGVEVTGKYMGTPTGDSRQTDIHSSGVGVATDATGFTNARYAILYFSTSGQLYAVGDLGADYSIQGGNALYINIAPLYINRYTLSPTRTAFT